MVKRRHFIKYSLGAAALTAAPASLGRKKRKSTRPFATLRSMTGSMVPISVEERRQRIEKAQKLMSETGIRAVFLDAGSSMFYFTGVKWWASERLFGVVIPARGEIAYVCPSFEEGRAQELIKIGSDVRAWEEDQSPFERVAQVFKDRKIRSGKIGVEQGVRFFLFDGIRKAAGHLEYVSADPVTVECRAIKSPAEIALLQLASDITIEAYRAQIPLLKEGMKGDDFRKLSAEAHAALGAKGSIGAHIGISSSFPHGSSKPRSLKEGDVVLMDGGCNVDGYRSDISRTVVFGKPTKVQQEIWDLASRAKAAAFAAARIGVPCEQVDAAARKVYEEYGFGPGYKTPGCPHRTGHGIGLDGHECFHLVRGNKRPLAPGMCFSNEPAVVLPGRFGIRLEDCFYMTEDGPRYLSKPSPSIDRPIA